MWLARLLARVPAALVALAMLVAVPLAQVPTAHRERTCCCPAARPCKCPVSPGGDRACVRPCGGSTVAVSLPTLAALPVAPVALAAPTLAPRPAPQLRRPAPHPAPWLPRPDAPS